MINYSELTSYMNSENENREWDTRDKLIDVKSYEIIEKVKAFNRDKILWKFKKINKEEDIGKYEKKCEEFSKFLHKMELFLEYDLSWNDKDDLKRQVKDMTKKMSFFEGIYPDLKEDMERLSWRVKAFKNAERLANRRVIPYIKKDNQPLKLNVNRECMIKQLSFFENLNYQEKDPDDYTFWESFQLMFKDTSDQDIKIPYNIQTVFKYYSQEIQIPNEIKPIMNYAFDLFFSLKVFFLKKDLEKIIKFIHWTYNYFNSRYQTWKEHFIVNNLEYVSPKYLNTLLCKHMITYMLLHSMSFGFFHKDFETKYYPMDYNFVKIVLQNIFFKNFITNYGYNVYTLESDTKEKAMVVSVIRAFSDDQFSESITELYNNIFCFAHNNSCPAIMLFNEYSTAKEPVIINSINLLKGEQKSLALLMLSFIYCLYPIEIIKYFSLYEKDLYIKTYANYVVEKEQVRLLDHLEGKEFLEGSLAFTLSNTLLFLKYLNKPEFREESFGKDIYDLDQVLKDGEKFVNYSNNQMYDAMIDTVQTFSKEYKKVMIAGGMGEYKIFLVPDNVNGHGQYI